MIAEGGSSNDASAQDAYTFAGAAYNFDKAKFGRDSFNAAGATMHSTVHYGVNDPVKDGQSYDDYPTRYTGGEDNGGVHLNSGIADLHPRGKTATDVPALGIDNSGAIFYRALREYLGSNATFQDARNATAKAAVELYGAATETATHAAWTAVGVPGAPSGNGGGGGDNGGGGGVCTGTP